MNRTVTDTIGKYSQFGEEQIIYDFFSDGLVVDVGAADGKYLSHSRLLIENGWRGVLIEPLPEHIIGLRSLYQDVPRVTVCEYAVAATEGAATLYAGGENSTLVPEWRDVAISNGWEYGEPVTVKTKPLAAILSEINCGQIDFLTVDAEMMDLVALQTNDWERWRPRLVCVETAHPTESIGQFMATVGYKFHAATPHNAFWRL